MIELSGLRRYVIDGDTARLEADIKFVDMNVKAPTETMWFEIDANYGGMFVDDTYDPFMLIGLYLAMYNHTDLKIRGNVSKKLYKNLTWYVQKILCDFSSDLTPVKIFVDGFAPTAATGTLIGTGISCGVDSLSTLYDRFVCEDDDDYKINALFFFNCGSNGDVGDDRSSIIAQSRCQRATSLAVELGLPLVPVDTNLHHFQREEFGDTLFFLSVYSCALALQNAIRRYYASSGYSYDEIKANGVKYADYDLAGFCESFLVPLIQTERTELIVDGCQYTRVDKIKKLADWDIARKYLNVCHVYSEDSHNCGECPKCLRTLLTLEILGKLDAFADIFKIEKYTTNDMPYKIYTVTKADTDVFAKENLDLAAEKNFPMPTHDDCYTLGKKSLILKSNGDLVMPFSNGEETQ